MSGWGPTMTGDAASLCISPRLLGATSVGERPLVSILTPSLNQAAFLGGCLASIGAQDYPRIEHIVVDGGSTDGTLELLRERGNALKLIVIPRASQAQALNAALKASTGDIVGWLNTDDAYISADVVATVVAALEADPGAVAAYGDAVIADGGGMILRHVRADAAGLRYARTISPLVQPAVFFRRSAVVDEFVREDLELALDYELWLRLSRRGRLTRIARILAVDRDHGTRKTQMLPKRVVQEFEQLAVEYDLRPPPPRLARTGRRWARRFAGRSEERRV